LGKREKKGKWVEGKKPGTTDRYKVHRGKKTSGKKKVKRRDAKGGIDAGIIKKKKKKKGGGNRICRYRQAE